MEENNTYTITNFNVLPNDLAFKASNHKYKLRWTGGTTVVDVNMHDIPVDETKFKPFVEIVAGKWRADILVREFNLNFPHISVVLCLFPIIIY